MARCIPYLLLALVAFLIFGTAIQLDAHLNPWDERFHALVAKNTQHDFLKPTLYREPLADIPHDTWDKAHVWLHKQPLFLWQMAASMRLFGEGVIPMRLPSMFLAVFLVLIAYRTACLLGGKAAGYVAASLVLANVFLFQLVSGAQGMDHNDVAFAAYAGGSLWAWVEWRQGYKLKWAVLAGLLAGAAVMCKWLAGGLVFGVWAFSFALEWRSALEWPRWRHFLIALGTSITLVLPWQLYIFSHYPEVAKAEWAYNSLHLWQAIEGHAGDLAFHFQQMPAVLGWPILILLPLGVLATFLPAPHRNTRIALLAGVLAVYAVFTLAATKMPGYPFMAIMPIAVLAGLGGSMPLRLARSVRPAWLPPLGLGIAMAILIGMGTEIQPVLHAHVDKEGKNAARTCAIHNLGIYTALKDSLPEKTVIFNVNGRFQIDMMFFTPFIAYEHLPSRREAARIHSGGWNVLLMEHPRVPVPDSLCGHIPILPMRLKGYL